MGDPKPIGVLVFHTWSPGGCPEYQSDPHNGPGTLVHAGWQNADFLHGPVGITQHDSPVLLGLRFANQKLLILSINRVLLEANK
jgi:hypothetical protein